MQSDDTSLENLEQTPEEKAISSSIQISGPSPSPSTSPSSSATSNNRFWKKWNKFTDRWRLLIIGFFIGIIWPFGLYTFPLFIENTDSTSESLSGTPSYDAENIYESVYGENNTTEMIVLLEQKSNFDESMIDANTKLYDDTKVFIENYRTYLKGLKHVEKVTVVSYYDLEEANMTTVATASFVSGNGTVQIFVIEYDVDEKNNLNDFLDDVAAWGDDHVPSALDIGYTGNEWFQKDISEKTVNDIKLIIWISLPLALIIVGLITERIALLIIPTIVIITATSLTSLVMYPIAAYGPKVSQYTPLAMVAVIISFSFDYSLFFLSRIVDGLQQQQHGEEMAIESALETAGHSIIVCGLTMVFCFLSENVLPVSILATMGTGAASATLSCMLVTLTLVTSILHTRFGKILLSLTNEKLVDLFMSFYRKCCRCFCSCSKKVTPVTDDDNSVEISTKQDDNDSAHWLGYPTHDSTTMPLLSTPPDSTGERAVEEAPSSLSMVNTTTCPPSKEQYNIWFELGMKITFSPTNHIIMILFLAFFIIPSIVFVPRLSTSISYDYYLSSEDQSEKTFHALSDDFEAGMPLPYKLIFDARDHDQDVTTSEGFKIMDKVLNRLTNSSDVAPLSSYTGISTVGGSFIPHRFYEESMECAMDCRIEAKKSLYILDAGVTSSEKTTTYASVILTVDPLSKEGTDWLVDSRNIIDDLEKEGVLNNYEVVIYGDAGIEYDNAEECYNMFPILIAIVTTIVIILMGVFYRSIVIVIGSIVSITSTILFSFGFSILVYQYGILDWLGIKALSSSMASDEDDEEIAYINPLLAFSWFVGLVLNHYVFLIDRVWEYRSEGYDDKSAVLLGLQGTAWVLTGAGTITAVTFGVFLLSEMPIMNQNGCMTVSAVFMNFVVRTLVVPILLGSYTAGFTWWPRQVPQGNLNAVADHYIDRNKSRITDGNASPAGDSVGEKKDDSLGQIVFF